MAGVNLVTKLRWIPIRDAIKAELEAVPSVLLVHPYLRWDSPRNANEARFEKLHIPADGKGIVNAWAISRNSQTREFLTNREYLVVTDVSLDFWYNLDDPKGSQDIFDEIVDDVLDRFEEPLRLSCEAELQGPIQLASEDHRYFAGKLTHHAELTTTVQHRVFTNQFR
jgi:hypothetical protein